MRCLIAFLLSLRTLSGKPRFSDTVMCGQTAYDWKTIPRLRRSAGTSRRRDASKNVSDPTEIRPDSGRWNPAIDISVVDLPQPDGPSSVNSSPSRTVKPTSSRARASPNCLTSDSTWISGIVTSRFADLEELRAAQQDEHRHCDLHDRQRRDWADDALDERREHGRPDHLVAGLHEEQRRVVVVQDLDEHQHERREDRRPQQRQDDAARRPPPARSDGAPGAVELLADPRERRVHDDVRERQVADTEGEADAPDRSPQPVAGEAGEQVRPEDADADDQAGHRARVEHHEG